MSGRTVGYARIIPNDEPRVTIALQAAGCGELHLERVTGTRSARPVWTALRPQLHEGDTLVVLTLADLNWALTRLLQMLADLQRDGVHFRSIAESIDSARASYSDLVEALSQFPGQVSQARAEIMRSTAYARARGLRGGRPYMLTPDQAAKAQQLYDQGDLTVDAIATQFHVSRSTVYRYLNRPASTMSSTSKESK